jgi:hypothetical protein
MIINIQKLYEDILSEYWQKIYQLYELVSTNSGSKLRQKSIKDREREYFLILERKVSLEMLFKHQILDNEIVVPDWYKQKHSDIQKKRKELDL